MHASSPSQLQQQIAWNRQSAAAWHEFKHHRQQVGRLLQSLAIGAAAGASAAPRLAVLGAGNCNDIDLAATLECFAEIQLCDWDRQAVLDGVQRQGLSHCERIVIDAPRDLSGLPQSAPRLQSETPLQCETPVQCVASIGLLSQQMLSITTSAAAADRTAQQTIAAAVAALRERHFELLIDRLVPSGGGVLSFEVVSSDTLPSLRTCSDADVPGIATTAIRAGNFYTGLHPAALLQTAGAFVAQGRLCDVQLHSPWRWTFGARAYAVTALSFRRTP